MASEEVSPMEVESETKIEPDFAKDMVDEFMGEPELNMAADF